MAEQLKPITSSPGTDTTLLGPEHARVYKETNGETGYIWNGVPILLLTTTGRKSGEKRTVPLIYRQVGDRSVIIASKGGSASHPAWYLNVSEDPEVEVQIKGDVFKARARTVEGAEREELWNEAASAWPNYNLYQTRTDRKIPVVALERIEKVPIAVDGSAISS
jgi:deazaflavin-dependent oxidoreductase (nitroreductase family)